MYISSHVFSYLLCFFPEGEQICMRPEVEGKYALPMEDNITDMKNPWNNLYITCLDSNAMYLYDFS